jgi:hypothetical protein
MLGMQGQQVWFALQTLIVLTIAPENPKSYFTPLDPLRNCVFSPVYSAPRHAGFGASRMARPNSSPNPSFEARREVVVPHLLTQSYLGVIRCLICPTFSRFLPLPQPSHCAGKRRLCSQFSVLLDRQPFLEHGFTVYKARFAADGKGQSSGLRIIYCLGKERAVVFVCVKFKNAVENESEFEKEALWRIDEFLKLNGLKKESEKKK